MKKISHPVSHSGFRVADVAYPVEGRDAIPWDAGKDAFGLQPHTASVISPVGDEVLILTYGVGNSREVTSFGGIAKDAGSPSFQVKLYRGSDFSAGTLVTTLTITSKTTIQYASFTKFELASDEMVWVEFNETTPSETFVGVFLTTQATMPVIVGI